MNDSTMNDRALRVGVIGLGDIARKAYLPVLATDPTLELHLCTRNPATLAAVGDAYRIEHRYRDVDQLLAAGIDAAFVHTATPSHVEVVSALLNSGVPTYVDKPLSGDLDGSTELVEKARTKSCSLMVGFNRRYAPVYRQLVGVPWSVVVMQKNRVQSADEGRRVVFDDFIHIVDTLRFLAPRAELRDVDAVVSAGLLQQLTVTLVGGGSTAIGVMNCDGGLVEEVLEVHGAGTKRRVTNMADVTEHTGGVERVTRRGDWTTVEQQRGFEAICAQFVAGVRAGQVFEADDALRTHQVCEQIVAEIG
jgi:virulence factor